MKSLLLIFVLSSFSSFAFALESSTECAMMSESNLRINPKQVHASLNVTIPGETKKPSNKQ
jgi:hypothetical protein